MATIRVLANARQLIDALAEHGPLSPAEAAKLLEIPRPTVYRLAEALAAVDLVEPLPDSRLALSHRWLRLAESARLGLTEWEGAGEILDRLAESTRQTAFLSVPRRTGAVCVAWAQGYDVGILLLRPGRSLPYHAGAAGRVLLALAHPNPDEFLEGAPIESFTAETMTEAASLSRDLDEIRARGYSVSDEDVTVGVGAVGMPVRDASGQVIAALSLSGFAGEIAAKRDEYVAATFEAVAELEVLNS
jgi:IclR family acetate operon transcriptional repressor